MATELTPEVQVILDSTFQKIHDIEGLLLARDPMLPGHLQAIHKNLSQYEELNHLLSDDQISRLLAGQRQVTGSVLITSSKSASKSSLTKQAKGITADDL